MSDDDERQKLVFKILKSIEAGRIYDAQKMAGSDRGLYESAVKKFIEDEKSKECTKLFWKTILSGVRKASVSDQLITEFYEDVPANKHNDKKDFFSAYFAVSLATNPEIKKKRGGKYDIEVHDTNGHYKSSSIDFIMAQTLCDYLKGRGIDAKCSRRHVIFGPLTREQDALMERWMAATKELKAIKKSHMK